MCELPDSKAVDDPDECVADQCDPRRAVADDEDRPRGGDDHGVAHSMMMMAKTDNDMETINGRVTTAVLRKMEPGETVVFEVGSRVEMRNGKSMAYQTSKKLDCRFVLDADYETMKLMITKTE